MRIAGLETRISKVISRVRARGWGEVSENWWGVLRQLAASNEVLMFLSRDLTSVIEPREAPEGTQFAEASVDDARRYARDVGTDSEKTFSARLSANTHCFLVISDETILHASWVTTTGAWTRELQRYFCPPSGEAYIFESFTRAETRGRGIYPYALHSICSRLKSEGVGRVWVGVEDGNQSSFRAITKAGFEPGFLVRHRRIVGKLTVEPPDGPGARPDHRFLGTSPDCRAD